MELSLQNLIRIVEKPSFLGNYSGLVDLELYGKLNANIETENLHLKSTGIVDGEILSKYSY